MQGIDKIFSPSFLCLSITTPAALRTDLLYHEVGNNNDSAAALASVAVHVHNLVAVGGKMMNQKDNI